MDFWERLKDMIKDKDLTQEWVAGKIHVPIGTFKNWLVKKTYPNAKQIVEIARILDVSVEYLVTGMEHGGITTEERQLVSTFRKLSDCEKLHIICTMEAWLRKFRGHPNSTLPPGCSL